MAMCAQGLNHRQEITDMKKGLDEEGQEGEESECMTVGVPGVVKRERRHDRGVCQGSVCLVAGVFFICFSPLD